MPAHPVPVERYFNRALNWVEFNRRILSEAMRERHPLLERVKLLATYADNQDRFFMVRVAAIHEEIASGFAATAPGALPPSEQLAQINRLVEELSVTQHRFWRHDLLPQLHAA